MFKELWAKVKSTDADVAAQTVRMSFLVIAVRLTKKHNLHGRIATVLFRGQYYSTARTASSKMHSSMVWIITKRGYTGSSSFSIRSTEELHLLVSLAPSRFSVKEYPRSCMPKGKYKPDILTEERSLFFEDSCQWSASTTRRSNNDSVLCIGSSALSQHNRPARVCVSIKFIMRIMFQQWPHISCSGVSW